MECANCGKEFGDGVNCQNCGVDRVTGLGSYSGYDRPAGSHKYHSSRGSSRYSSNNGEFSSMKTTICYVCSEIIPAGSMFCPYCKKELLVTCPKCGKTYSTQYSVCNQCGANRHDYYLKQEAKKQEKKRQEKEEQYIREAQNIKDSFIPSKASILVLPLTALILFVLTPLCPFSGPGVLGVVIVGAILLWGIAYMISESIGQSKTTRWKEEHPNDPRSKYL